MNYLSDYSSSDACPHCHRSLAPTTRERRFCEFCGEVINELSASPASQIVAGYETERDFVPHSIACGPLVQREHLQPFYFPRRFMRSNDEIVRDFDPPKFSLHTQHKLRILDLSELNFSNYGMKIRRRYQIELELLNPGYFEYSHVRQYLQEQSLPDSENDVIKEIEHRRTEIDAIFIEWLRTGKFFPNQQEGSQALSQTDKVSTVMVWLIIIAGVVFLGFPVLFALLQALIKAQN